MPRNQMSKHADYRVVCPKVADYFRTHIGCTCLECAAELGLTSMQMHTAISHLRSEWGSPRKYAPRKRKG